MTSAAPVEKVVKKRGRGGDIRRFSKGRALNRIAWERKGHLAYIGIEAKKEKKMSVNGHHNERRQLKGWRILSGRGKGVKKVVGEKRKLHPAMLEGGSLPFVF